MRLGLDEEPGEAEPAVRREYETIGYVLKGHAEPTQADQTLRLEGETATSCPTGRSTASGSWRRSPRWRPEPAGSIRLGPNHSLRDDPRFQEMLEKLPRSPVTGWA